MNDFCKVRTRNLRIDMTNCLDVTGSAHHSDPIAQFLRSDFTELRELCDVRLRFEDESIMTHSVILAAFSSTFSEKLKKPQEFDLDLKFLKKESVKKVLDFMYFGKVKLCFGNLHDDLEAISYFGVSSLQEEVEKKLIVLAKQGKCVDVLNLITANLKAIPHSPSTMLAVSDETVSEIVSTLHELSSTNKIPYEEILKLSTNTIITMLSSRIQDLKKVDIINMSLKWIYERRLSNHRASNILRGLTFGTMTYAELVNFRDSLIQTALPVAVGRCVRLKMGENDTLEIEFTYAESSGYQPPSNKSVITPSVSLSNDPTSLGVVTLPGTLSAEITNTSSSHTNFETSRKSASFDCNVDDCNTAMSFTAEDLKRLGFDRTRGQNKK
ncbi:hypothetical protein CRE_18835 [Caenorhabditis remanei]|uniref:BTB domain-containing protein n=1 Tax=Caenorhabditis remanei TaxID=31234 RepID=E3LKT4_CAERE|nr:hypothetical protein CRE_18835 [Caenorhabditis remanei]